MSGTTLGEFGKVHEPPKSFDEEEATTFMWFGEAIRLEERYNQVRLLNLMERAHKIDVRDPMAMIIVKDMLHVLIDTRDFMRFWTMAEEYEQTLEDLVYTAEKLMEGMSARPTQPLSDSSVGQPSSEENLPDDSDRPASRGRPDLQQLMDGAKRSRDQVAAALG